MAPFGTQGAPANGLTYKFWFEKSKLKPEQAAELISDYHFTLNQNKLIGFDWVRPNTSNFKNIPNYLSIHQEYIRLN